MVRRLVTAFAVLLALAGRSRAQGTWDPTNTHALVVGLYDFEEKSTFTPFPEDQGRVDRALVASLVGAGVPRANITALEDRGATLEAIRAELARTAERSGPGSTLIVYFGAHGWRENGKTYIANYDASSASRTKMAFDVGEVKPILDAHWRGERLLVFSDSCYSGGLNDLVARYEGTGKKVATFASTTRTNVSNGWTFTESLAKFFGKSRLADVDHDGLLTLGDFAAFLRREMKFVQDQLALDAHTKNFDPRFVLSRLAGGEPDPRIGRYPSRPGRTGSSTARR